MKTRALTDGTYAAYTRVLGERIRRARADKNLSQARAAAAAGLSVTTYRRIEAGGPVRPRLLTIWAIAQALDVPVGTLVTFRADRLVP